MESINEGNGDDSELNVVVRQADLHTAILEAVQKRGYTENQAMAIVCGSVSLPSGSGKSLCYAAFPEVSDSLKRRANIASDHHSIAVVVPPPLTEFSEEWLFGGWWRRTARNCTNTTLFTLCIGQKMLMFPLSRAYGNPVSVMLV